MPPPLVPAQLPLIVLLAYGHGGPVTIDSATQSAELWLNVLLLTVILVLPSKPEVRIPPELWVNALLRIVTVADD